MKTKLTLLTAATLLAAIGAGFAQPVITQQPRSCTNGVGTTATFTVEATGTGPLAYQWQKLGANWSDLTGSTDPNLCLTYVQTSHAGDYRVVVTNETGAVTSDVAHLYLIVPPRITPTASLQSTSVGLGQGVSFAVTASGTTPLSYQWRLDGRDLAGQTNGVFTLTNAQPADEAGYTVVVTNLAGAATSEPAWLYVVPPITELIRGDFTNASGARLPYFYFVPTNYVPTQSYPLWFYFHGSDDYVSVFLTRYSSFRAVGQSYGRQLTNPTILVWPTRWYSGEDWTPQYLQLTSGLLDRLISQFNIDTNRIYVGGGSQGVHAAWDLMAMRPGLFAAAVVGAGWSGSSPARSIKDVPLWVSCARDDDAGLLPDTQNLVRSLRLAGGNPIYTEYNSGGHLGGIIMLAYTPAFFDWLLAQRRGVASTNEPLLSITRPTQAATYASGATNLDLAGLAGALDRTVTKVTWENTANNKNGNASGTNTWSATGIPLAANKSNLLIVTATTTSWAPAYGGNTTFNDTLTVIQSPIRATLTLQGTNALLNWTGGGPPYRVQRATALAASDWTDLLPDATAPVLLPLPLGGEAGFYRIVGQ